MLGLERVLGGLAVNYTEDHARHVCRPCGVPPILFLFPALPFSPLFSFQSI